MVFLKEIFEKVDSKKISRRQKSTKNFPWSMLGNFCMLFFCQLLTFFKFNFLKKKLSGTLSECQMIWTQIRTDILSVLIWVQRISVLIWVQTVYKDYQQMTKGTTTEERVYHISKKVLDSRLRGSGFEPHWRHCVVSLSKTH